MGEQALLFCLSGELANVVILRGIPISGNDVSSNDSNRTVRHALTRYDHTAGSLTVQDVKAVFLEVRANVLVRPPPSTAMSRRWIGSR